MHCLQKQFTKVGFLAVYISEAHAVDEWKLGNKICIKQHKTLEERIEAAKSFVKDFDFQLPMVVDGMMNQFDKTYAVWPDRFFGISKGIMRLIPQPGEYGYQRLVIEQWLKQEAISALESNPLEDQ